MIRRCGIVLFWMLAWHVAMAQPASAAKPPAWAYPVPPADSTPASDNSTLLTVPDSTERYTQGQVSDPFFAPDWHPHDHPSLPEIVAHGRKPDVFACGYCHRAEGTGGPENAGIAGLPYAYIVQQLADYKDGSRSTALPERAPQKWMISLSKVVTEEEVQQAARYFSSLKPKQNIRAVETAKVPKTYVAGWFLAVSPGKATEPIGDRIIETPENVEQFESRDSRTKFVAYVPPGSLRRGGAIVNGKVPAVAPACAICHGKSLTGMGPVPSIAGRSPSYLFRQLYEFQAGIRSGKNAAQMKQPVANLSLKDMTAVAAYLASLKP